MGQTFWLLGAKFFLLCATFIPFSIHSCTQEAGGVFNIHLPFPTARDPESLSFCLFKHENLAPLTCEVLPGGPYGSCCPAFLLEQDPQHPVKEPP